MFRYDQDDKSFITKYLNVANVGPIAGPGKVMKKSVFVVPFNSTIMFGFSEVSPRLHRSLSSNNHAQPATNQRVQ